MTGALELETVRGWRRGSHDHRRNGRPRPTGGCFGGGEATDCGTAKGRAQSPLGLRGSCWDGQRRNGRVRAAKRSGNSRTICESQRRQDGGAARMGHCRPRPFRQSPRDCRAAHWRLSDRIPEKPALVYEQAPKNDRRAEWSSSFAWYLSLPWFFTDPRSRLPHGQPDSLAWHALVARSGGHVPC
jgi:hypothetical protein